jgi:hypothetical protein
MPDDSKPAKPAPSVLPPSVGELGDEMRKIRMDLETLRENRESDRLSIAGLIDSIQGARPAKDVPNDEFWWGPFRLE